MIIAADATTFANKAIEMIDTEIAGHMLALSNGAGIDDHATYRWEVGYIAGLRTAKACMVDAAKELSDPQSKRENT